MAPPGSSCICQLSLHTPVGDLTVTDEDGVIVSVDWGWGRDQAETPLLRQTCDRLQDYFDGAPVDFGDLPIAQSGTPYRQRVWAQLRRIPRGQVVTYAELAAAAGGAPRSAGQANGANHVPILVPCHRVIASGGRIGGYSGGDGVPTKRLLLGLESAQAAGFPA